jgi:hypothetical protein
MMVHNTIYDALSLLLEIWAFRLNITELFYLVVFCDII